MAGGASEFVGNIPENYDRGLGPVIFDDYASDIAWRAASYSPDNILELAAGTGLVTRKLRDRIASSTKLTATDLNPPMLDVARSKFGPNEQIVFEQADAMDIAYPDNSFDLIICQFGVMFFPDKVASFRGALRVLQPGGTYLFNVWGTHAENPFAGIAQQVSEEYFPDDPPGFYRVPFSYADTDVVRQDLETAGFTKIEVMPVSLTKRLPDIAGFARGVVYGNPLFDEIKKRNGVGHEEFMATIVQRFRAAWPGPSPIMPLKATIFAAS